MKFAQRMVLIPESEYLSLKAGSSKIEKRKVKSKRPPPAKVRIEKLSQYFSPEHQAKVDSIERELKTSGVSWNSNFEIITSYGDTLYNTNILDLLKYALTSVPSNPGKPLGYSDFVKLLSQTKVPVGIFSRKTAREALHRARGSSTWEVY